MKCFSTKLPNKWRQQKNLNLLLRVHLQNGIFVKEECGILFILVFVVFVFFTSHTHAVCVVLNLENVLKSLEL